MAYIEHLHWVDVSYPSDTEKSTKKIVKQLTKQGTFTQLNEIDGISHI